MQRRHRVLVTPVGDDAVAPASACARVLRDAGLEAVLVPATSADAVASTAAQEDVDAVVLASSSVAVSRALAEGLIAALIRVGSDASLALHADDEPMDPALLSELLDARMLEPSTP